MPHKHASRRAPAARLWGIPLLLLLAVGGHVSAHSETRLPLRMDPTGGPTYWSGSSALLPNHPGVTESEILEHALTMPAVQELLAEAERRGYLRHPESDRGFVRSSPRMVGALLALEKPGFSPPPGETGGPLLYVTTVDVYGTPRTITALTLLLADESNGTVRTADEEPTLPDDGTVEFLASASSGGGSGRYQVHPEGSYTPQRKYCTKRFVYCAAFGSAGCVVQALLPPEPTQVKVIRIVLCAAAATLSCLGDFFQCLDQPQ